MKLHSLFLLLASAGPWLAASALPHRAGAADVASVRALFANLPRQYSTAPLWVWNDLLSERQIRQTLRDLAGQQVRQVFVHPRPGLMTPYLSEDWFRLWSAALDEAERLDMNVWIYDENSYPSGFAGGFVPRRMPESRGRGLRFQTVRQLGTLDDAVLGVYVRQGDDYRDVTAEARAGKAPEADGYLIARVERAPDRDWTAGGPYVDLLHPGVTQKFIDVTMEAYRRRFGDQFGKRIPGWFTDEPHLAPMGLPHWSDHLPRAFRERWGYDLIPRLPSLQAQVGDWKRVRHNYFQLLLEEFIRRWAQPCYEYCEEHDLEFTGHYWEHGWPSAGHGGDNMAMYAWHQRPAIDILMNQYDEGVHSQFGNARSVKELSSVANQLGLRRTLCEAYGAGGWDLRFEDMKRIGEWLIVLGVNTIDEHLSYVTIRGTRKRDHPQSFSYHEPWWPDYHVIAQSMTRLCAAMSHGQQVNRILVIEPTTTAWMDQPDASSRPALTALGADFQSLVNALERAQVEYDLGCEDVIARNGAVLPGSAGGAASSPRPRLVVGRRAYHTVVLAPHTENLNQPTMRLLEKYVAAGGRLLSCGPPPERVDGQLSPRGERLAKRSSWRTVDAAQAPEALQGLRRDGFGIDRTKGDQGILFHQRRRLDDGQLLLLVNSSIEHSSSGVVHCRAAAAQRWRPQSGRVEPYPLTASSGGSQLTFHLPPCGSLLLLLSDRSSPEAPGGAVERPNASAGRTEAAAADGSTRGRRICEPTGPLRIEPLGPNVLPLDFLDVTVGEETQRDTYCYNAARFVFQKHGFEKNPWDHAVQFGDEFIRHKFPGESGFRATYRFSIEPDGPRDLQVVVERPDLYSITCNGKSVKPIPGKWWLDRAFGRIDLSDAAREGENQITLTARPMTMFHEIEAVYLLGDFSLRAVDRGWTIAPTETLRLGPWNEQGMPFYAEGVSYEQTFEIDRPSGRYVVRCPSWYGSVAEVRVDGELAGHLVSRPWEVDVSDRIHAGSNRIEVRVIGTLKNTLGPHHGRPGRGRAWPQAFREAPAQGPPPGSQYDTIGYGLLDAVVLENWSAE